MKYVCWQSIERETIADRVLSSDFSRLKLNHITYGSKFRCFLNIMWLYSYSFLFFLRNLLLSNEIFRFKLKSCSPVGNVSGLESLLAHGVQGHADASSSGYSKGRGDRKKKRGRSSHAGINRYLRKTTSPGAERPWSSAGFCRAVLTRFRHVRWRSRVERPRPTRETTFGEPRSSGLR